MELSEIEARVLGALMEKARTTPDVYPLTLNSVVLACNQKTSRDPVTQFDEDEVEQALDSLREKHLAMRVDMAGSRTAKFRENIASLWELEREEYALLTVLLLRGPQTPGQLRQRCERLFPFAELPQVTDWLGRMQRREEEPHTLVQSLGRAPGTKEIRYSHTLAPVPEHVPPAEPGFPDTHEPNPPASSPLETAPDPSEEPSRLDQLEESVQQLEKRISELEILLNDLTT
jgi:uncharacterized protein YceH (UPF0502 family)